MKASLTVLVKHTKSMAFVNPCAESPIPFENEYVGGRGEECDAD